MFSCDPFRVVECCAIDNVSLVHGLTFKIIKSCMSSIEMQVFRIVERKGVRGGGLKAGRRAVAGEGKREAQRLECGQSPSD